MTENNIQNRIDTLFTQSGADQVVNAVDQLEKKTKSVEGQTKKTADAFSEWERRAKQLDRTLQLNKIQSELVKAARSGKDMGDAFERANKQLKELNATANETRSTVGGAADIASTSASGARAAFFREARLSAPAIPIPGTRLSSEAIFRGGEIFSKLGIGLKEIAIGGPVAIAAVAGVALALQNFRDTVEPIADLLFGLTKGRAELAGLLETGSPEEIVAEARRRNRELADLKAQRESLGNDLALLSAELEKQQPELADFARALLSGPAPDIGFIINDIIAPLLANNTGPLADLRGEFVELGNQITTNENELDALNKELEKQARIAEANRFARSEIQAEVGFLGQSATAIQERINALNDENRALDNYKKTHALTQDVLDEIAEKQQNNAILLRAAFNALPGAQASQRVEDAKKALEAIGTGAVRIQQQSQERIERIVEQGAKQIESAEKHLSDARIKLVDFNTEIEEKRAEINADFMKDDVERVKEFREEEKRLNRDADKERIRALEDHQNALLDAEIENNVARFLQEQRDFKTEQQRRAEDNRTATDDRLDDLEEERQKSRDLRQEKLAALDAEAAKKRADLQTEIEERSAALETVKQQILDRVEAEKAAQAEALRNLIAQYDPAVNHMVQTTQQGFAIIEQAGISATQNIANALNQLQRQAGVNYLSSGISASNSILRSPIDTGHVIPFAGGGNAPANKIVRINDGGGVESGLDRRGQLAVFSNPTRVFSASDTARLFSGGGGGTNITLNMSNVNLGAMTTETFKTVMTGILQEQAQGIAAARYGRLAS
jgi:DNA repair exonuclease SbcCD ATPase subunit